jgi:hypothetical protein
VLGEPCQSASRHVVTSENSAVTALFFWVYNPAGSYSKWVGVALREGS